MADIKFTKFGKLWVNSGHGQSLNAPAQVNAYYSTGMTRADMQALLPEAKDIYGNLLTDLSTISSLVINSSPIGGGSLYWSYGSYSGLSLNTDLTYQQITNIFGNGYSSDTLVPCFSDGHPLFSSNNNFCYVQVGTSNTPNTDSTYGLVAPCSTDDCYYEGTKTNYGFQITITNKRNTALSISEIAHIIPLCSATVYPNNSGSTPHLEDVAAIINAANLNNSSLTTAGITKYYSLTSSYGYLPVDYGCVFRAVLDSPVVIPVGERRVISVDLSLDI